MHTRTQTRTHRLIPTHAGKTGPNAGVWSVSWAHPHSRGENCKGIDRAGRDNGSSPLTRGKHYPHPKTRSDRRLIPTHAGKTCLPVRRRRGPEAHPHSRGENTFMTGIPPCNGGSSPLTRGKRPQAHPRLNVTRLIPTHAGKTNGPAPSPGRGRAHPHSRGENLSWLARLDLDQGSSPLTRGKLTPGDASLDAIGLIPTHAGKTIECRPEASDEEAHPHSRGENGSTSVVQPCGRGSSPLTRGKPCSPRSRSFMSGLIPTHAGKTGRRWPVSRRRRAHPHSRGEN